MTIAWLLGWAVPIPWYTRIAQKALPQAEHRFFRPQAGVLDRIESSGPLDWVVGYSLGTLLLLREAERVSKMGRVGLLAPIFGFAREQNLGGSVPRSELALLLRRVRSNAPEALMGFYERAGLEVDSSEIAAEDPGSLLWGLEQLYVVSVPSQLPANWRAWCGENDSLLDSRRLGELEPRITIIPGGTHDPESLIRAFAAEAPS